MPGETGFELCRRIKSTPELAEITVIFITAHSGLDFELQALEAGAADFIGKPISAPSVQLRLELHLKLKRQLDELRVLAGTDGLTQLANRRTLDETLLREWTRARRSGSELSFILIDVDHFKFYNDTYGHPAGDRCLQEVAGVLRGIGQRPADIAGRYGGEEFALILPDTGETGALHVGNLLREAIVGLGILHEASPVAEVVTVSVGVSSWQPPPPTSRPTTTDAQAHDLVRAADQALYSAKGRGRDRVEFLSLSQAVTNRVS
jgi:diguanylate cyclase (GGDEF)-like protein